MENDCQTSSCVKLSHWLGEHIELTRCLQAAFGCVSVSCRAPLNISCYKYLLIICVTHNMTNLYMLCVSCWFERDLNGWTERIELAVAFTVESKQVAGRFELPYSNLKPGKTKNTCQMPNSNHSSLSTYGCVVPSAAEEQQQQQQQERSKHHVRGAWSKYKPPADNHTVSYRLKTFTCFQHLSSPPVPSCLGPTLTRQHPASRGHSYDGSAK